MRTCCLPADAIGVLRARGAEEGTLRPDVDPYAVLLAIGGMTLITGGPGRAAVTGRLLELPLDGLRPRAGTARRCDLP